MAGIGSRYHRVAAALLAVLLASCGGGTDDDRKVRRDGDTVSVNLGDGIGTVSADASGKGRFTGMGGAIDMETSGEVPKLPAGITLPAGSTVTSSMTPHLPGMKPTTIVEAQATGTIADVSSHFRGLAKAAGMAIERDEVGEGEFIVAATSPTRGGFSAVIRPDGDGSSYILTVNPPAG